MNKQIKTSFHDGKTSDEHDVLVDFFDEHIAITNIESGEKHSWKFAEIEIEEKPIDGRKGLVSSTTAPRARLYLEIEEFREVARKIPRSKSKALRLALGIAIAMAAIIGLIFFAIPALAPAILPHVPQSWDKKLGDYAARYFIDPAKRCSGAEGNKHLSKLAEALSRRDNEFELSVVVQESDIINAFALPGGKIVLFKPIIEKAESQEELIGVLAHEAGHVHYRHGTERMLRYLSSTLIIDALTGGAGTAAYAAMEFHAHKYGQEQEMESDSWAVEELHRLDIEPAKFADFFSRMQQMQIEEMAEDDNEFFDKISEYVSTHPSSDARVDNITKMSDKLKTQRKSKLIQFFSEQEWREIKQICN